MEPANPSLGLCFFDQQLYYAVSKPEESGALDRIGSVDFNFDVTDALTGTDRVHFSGVRKTVQQLKKQYGINHLRILSIPSLECWTVLPKIVYDKADEREAHINILMKGVDRKQIEPTWHELSNQDYKLLLLRNTKNLDGFSQFNSDASNVDLISDFEIGSRWTRHVDDKGSFLTICCFHNCISVSSYLLGKLRGATYISFDDAEDLPYLWLQQARQISWMQGIHDQILVYGYTAYRIIEILQPFWDDPENVIKMDSMEKMGIHAPEETYGFNLENAFPAIMLAVEV